MGKSLFVVVSFYIAASLFQSFSVRLRELGRFDGIKTGTEVDLLPMLVIHAHRNMVSMMKSITLIQL